MARLIDELIRGDSATITRAMGDKWFIAKPVQYRVYSWFAFKSKCLDIWRVITNKGFVVYYKEDEKI